ncbi:hypothetical protein [Streptomyces sp. NPDC060188]|uniref:hypothetical protein n=1 Tax=Streptomyces sp. NPDC060188 TaxID=3347068 RepID=UPI00364EA7F3
MGALLILLSLVSAVLCHFVFAVWLPSDRERYRDYEAAEPCRFVRGRRKLMTA